MKGMKKLAALALSFVMVLSLVSVVPATNASAATKKSAKAAVTIVTPTKSSAYAVGRASKNVSLTLKYSITNCKVAKYSVVSSNTKVVAVSNSKLRSAKLTCKSVGTAVITVKIVTKDKKTVKDTLKVVVRRQADKVSTKISGLSTVAGYYVLKPGVSKKLTTVVSPSNTYNKKVVYTTSNKKVATVDKYGKITVLKTAKAGQTAIIKATTADGSKKSAYVKVKVFTPVSKIVVGGTVNMKTGATYYASKNITVLPSTANDKTVTYATSNKNVVTVASNGKMVAVGRGTAMITVTAKDGSKVKNMFKVVVTDKTVKNIVVNPETKVSATVEANNVEDLLNDVESAASTCKAQLDTLSDKDLSLVVGDTTYTVTYSDGKLTYSVPKEEIIAKANGKTVKFNVPANDNLENMMSVAQTIQDKALLTNKYNVTLTFTTADGKESSISNVKLGSQYTTFTEGTKTYKMFMENENIYLVGSTVPATLQTLAENGAISIM